MKIKYFLTLTLIYIMFAAYSCAYDRENITTFLIGYPVCLVVIPLFYKLFFKNILNNNENE